MADRIISLKLSLKGQSATLKQLDAVTLPLAEAGKLLADIKTKSVSIDTATQKVKQLTQQFQLLNKEIEKAGKANIIGSATLPKSPTTGRPVNQQSSARAELLTLDQESARYRELVALVAQYKQKQAEVTAEIRKQAKEFEATKFAVGSYKDLNAQLIKAKDTYRQLSAAQREGVVGKTLLGNITQLDTKLKSIDRSIGQYTRSVGNYSSALSGLRSVATQYLSVTALLAAGGQVIRQNAEISDSIANVAKTANASIPDIQKLAEELKFRDTRTSLADQLKIAEIGGQLGETADTLASFTAAVDVLGVALGDEFGNDVGRVTKEVAGLRNTLGSFKTDDTAGDILKLGNALNVLSASGNATAGVTTDIASRLAGLGTAFGLSAGQILGLASRLDELNVPAERAGGSIQRVLNEIAKSPEVFAKVSGKSIPEFTKIVNEDLVEAFELVLDTIGKSGAKTTEFADILDKLGLRGVGAIEIFSKLGQNTDALRASIDLASKSLENTDSIYGEFTKKNQTLGAEIDKLKNTFINLTTGETVSGFFAGLVRLINDVVTSFGELGRAVADFINPLDSLKKKFSEQTIELKKINTQIPILLSQYGELNAITTPTTEEQEKLKSIIQEITAIFPTAITAYDEYGKAVAFSRQEVIKMSLAQEQMNASTKKALIEGTEKEIESLNEQIKQAGIRIEQAKTFGLSTERLNTSIRVNLGIIGDLNAKLKEETALLASLKSNQDDLNESTKKSVDLTNLSILQLEKLGTEDAKAEILRRKTLYIESVKERERAEKEAERERKQRREKELEEIKRAAENIQRLTLDALGKDFEGRRQRAEKEGEIAISALVGTPEQVKTQTELIRAQVTRSIEEINKEFAVARAKALQEIETFRQEITSGNADFQLLGAEREVSATTRFYENQLQQLRLAKAQQFAELEKSFLKGEVSAEQFEARRVAQEQEFAQKRLDVQKLENAELLVADANKLTKELEQKEAAFQKELKQIEKQKLDREAAIKKDVESGALSSGEGTTGIQASELLANELKLQAEQKFLEDKDKLNADFAKTQIERQIDLAEQEVEISADKTQRLIDIQTRYTQAFAVGIESLGAAFGDFLTDQERGSKEFARNIIRIALETLKRIVLISVAEVTAKQIAEKGYLGIITAAALNAIIEAGFAVVETAVTGSFEKGGAIPGTGATGEGVAQGPSHERGGIRIGSNEIEGGEHILRNGKESYVINKKSSRAFNPELRALHGNPNRFSPEKRAIAEQINMFKGFGRAFAPVKKYAGGGALSISPLGAPVLTSQSDAASQFIGLTNNIIAMVDATNKRIDRIEIIADPLELARLGNKKAEVKAARSL